VKSAFEEVIPEEIYRNYDNLELNITGADVIPSNSMGYYILSIYDNVAQIEMTTTVQLNAQFEGENHDYASYDKEDGEWYNVETIYHDINEKVNVKLELEIKFEVGKDEHLSEYSYEIKHIHGLPKPDFFDFE
jgi:hypothetical protein